jgi:hypothetical protein
MAARTRAVPAPVLSQIAEAIGGIRYGSVHVIIQDSRVIRIEKAEKIRVAPHGVDLIAGDDGHTPRVHQASGDAHE